MPKETGFHTADSLIQGTRVHRDGTHEDIGWVDERGNVHRTNDSGTILSDPETIGHVNSDGSVTIDKKP